MNTKDRDNEGGVIPSVSEFVQRIKELEGGLEDCISLSADIGLSVEPAHKNWTPLTYLQEALIVTAPYANLRKWDSAATATALFRTYMACLQVTGRQELQEKIRIVKGLCRETRKDEYKSHTWIEYKEGDEIKEVEPTINFNLPTIGYHLIYEARGGNLSDDLDRAMSSRASSLPRVRDLRQAYAEVIPVSKSKWGSEVTYFLVGNRPGIFRTGIHKGIC